jgi:hypothetical protein
LNWETFAKELEGKPKSAVEILYVPNDPESYWFANEISRALDIAKWGPVWPNPIPSPPANLPVDAATFAGGSHPESELQ